MEWILPQHQKLTLAGNGKPLEGKKEIAPLSDLQILQLLDEVPTQEWRNLLLVMAVYGLRPEEVMHLSPKVNPTTGKLQLWCSYCKAAGGRTTKTETKPRWLQAIPLNGPDGVVPQNDLAQLIESGLFPFPPLGDRGAAIGQYLGRQKTGSSGRPSSRSRANGCGLTASGTPIPNAATGGASPGRPWPWRWGTANKRIARATSRPNRNPLQSCSNESWARNKQAQKEELLVRH